MHLFHVNIFAVIVATIACMALGATWYSNMLFAKPWMNAIGKKMEDLKPAPTNYLVVCGCFLVMSFIFGKVLYYTRITDLVGSIELAVMIWLGFIITTTGINYIFEGKPRRLFLINTGYHLATLLVISIILGLWK